MSVIRTLKRPLLALAVLSVLLLVVWRAVGSDAPTAAFRTAPVKRSDLTVTISATGTVEPEEVIDVGAQVAGQISEFGVDKKGQPIDYGSEIEAGMLLAKIDDTIYKSDVDQAEAQLKNAQANLLQMKARLNQAERDWARAQKLGASEALSQASFDQYRATFESAQANIAIAEAQIVQANASVQKAHRNLAFCTIKSPVSGVVIDRRVNIGQTVVSSLNTPSLFLIAKDLRRMQVWVAVNEADIGNIRVGQPVQFGVDAFPGEVFHGEVGKIRLNATMTQNVVTYIVEVTTDNSNNRLLPYLTANAKFEVSNSKGVLVVPNAALRWSPLPAQVVMKSDDRKSARSRMSEEDAGTSDESSRESGVVWFEKGDKVEAVKVRVVGSDGSFTQIEGDGITEGAFVVVGMQKRDSAESASGTTNPFAPQIPRRRNNGRSGG